MARELIDKYLDDSVVGDGQDVWTQPDIPSGGTWHLTRFGAMALNAAVIALQKRTSVGPDVWETIRAVAGPGHGEYLVDQDLLGPDDKIRIVRQEKSGSAQQIVAWVEGYKMV